MLFEQDFQIEIGKGTWMIEGLSQVTHSALDPGSYHGVAKSKAL